MITDLYFKASLGKTALVITIAITVLFASIILLPFLISPYRVNGITLTISVFLLLIYLLTFFLRPSGYRLTSTQLIITRPSTNITINKTEIRNVQLIEPSEINGSIRTFGSGGLFGYFGKFANRTFGTMTWYATRQDNIVLIKTVSGKTIIITPDEPALFVAQFHK